MLSLTQGEGLTQADLNVVFAKEVVRKKAFNTKSLAKRKNPSLMTYSDFLNVLMILAPKIYPETSPDSVFQKLLLENVLPLAAKRIPVSVKEYILENSDIYKLLREEVTSPNNNHSKVNDGLEGIFNYYCELSDRRRKKQNAEEVQEHKKLKQGNGLVAVSSRSQEKYLQATRNLLSYHEYIIFCQDFKIFAKSVITTIQAGDIYLSSVDSHHGGDNAHDMNFEQFQEVILRIALTAYSDKDDISECVKVKALLLSMWKSVNTADATEKAVQGRGNQSVCDASKSTKSGDLNLYGSSTFNIRVLNMWREDQWRDYLVPVPEPELDGQTVLKRMLENSNLRLKELSIGLESSAGSDGGGHDGSVTSTLSTTALGKMLSEKPHVAEELLKGLSSEL